MSHEAKLALERIVKVCEKAAELTPRQIRLFDIALEGLGLVSGQRREILAKWETPLMERIQRRRDRIVARREVAN